MKTAQQFFRAWPPGDGKGWDYLWLCQGVTEWLRDERLVANCGMGINTGPWEWPG